MATLTVTAKGQVTFRKDLLQHLGIEPGEKVETVKLPGGRLEVRAARPKGSIENFFGMLQSKTTKVATIEEIDDAAASSWGHKE